MKNAQRLDQWLRTKCSERGVAEFTAQELMQLAPKPLRKKEALEPVLSVLASLGRIKVTSDSPRMVKVNPALVHQA